MIIQKITSYDEMIDQMADSSKAFVLLYKDSSDLSSCALSNMESAIKESKPDVKVLCADVGESKDIHGVYDVSSVPSLLVFENGEFVNVIKGCMDSSYYTTIISGLGTSENRSVERLTKRKSVTVYSTPTCSWCTKIKEHLRANNIRFKEIDVAANPGMAEVMKGKSGQMGVPQTEIDGQMIVGFDRHKIDKLLNIV